MFFHLSEQLEQSWTRNWAEIYTPAARLTQNDFNTVENHLSTSHQEDKGLSLNFLTLPSNITSEFFRRNLHISDVGTTFISFRLRDITSVTSTPWKVTTEKAILYTEEKQGSKFGFSSDLIIWANTERLRSRKKKLWFTYSLSNLYNQKI